jgi:hypothetical protein
VVCCTGWGKGRSCDEEGLSKGTPGEQCAGLEAAPLAALPPPGSCACMTPLALENDGYGTIINAVRATGINMQQKHEAGTKHNEVHLPACPLARFRPVTHWTGVAATEVVGDETLEAAPRLAPAAAGRAERALGCPR